MEELKRIVEALLFASSEPLSVVRMRSLIVGSDANEIVEAIDALKEDYAHDSRSFQIVQMGGGYLITTKSDYAPWVTRLFESRAKQRLSRAALETLAVVAYKQPVMRSAVEAIRGVNVEGVLRTLMERNLVRIIGRGDGPGRPLLFGTTREFLMQFGINRLSDLPALREIEGLISAQEGSTVADDSGKSGSGENHGREDKNQQVPS
jgi:segregation and condensation protein B